MPICGGWAGCIRVDETLCEPSTVARDAFDRVSFDLIYARQDQTPGDVGATNCSARLPWLSIICPCIN